MLRCEHCDYFEEFVFGVGVRTFSTVEEYIKANRLRKIPAQLSPHKRIEPWFSYLFYQCPECHNLYGSLERHAHDQSGNVVERKGRSKCPRCGGKGRKIDVFEEGLSKLQCARCKATGLVVEDLGLSD